MIVSTAEIGKVHLGIKASAARYCEAESGANQIFGKRKGTAKTSRSRFAYLDSREPALSKVEGRLSLRVSYS